MRTFSLLLMCFLCSTLLSADTNIQNTLNKVLNELYHSYGNYILDKPKIELAKGDNEPALFLRRSNIIRFSDRAYKVCQSMGKDSLTAIAFILGHELAHIYESDFEGVSTSLLKYHHHHDQGIIFEESADVQGIFNAYQAGYKHIVNIIPGFIEKNFIKNLQFLLN